MSWNNKNLAIVCSISSSCWLCFTHLLASGWHFLQHSVALSVAHCPRRSVHVCCVFLWTYNMQRQVKELMQKILSVWLILQNKPSIDCASAKLDRPRLLEKSRFSSHNYNTDVDFNSNYKCVGEMQMFCIGFNYWKIQQLQKVFTFSRLCFVVDLILKHTKTHKQKQIFPATVTWITEWTIEFLDFEVIKVCDMVWLKS